MRIDRLLAKHAERNDDADDTARHPPQRSPTKSCAICRASAASIPMYVDGDGSSRQTAATRDLINPSNGEHDRDVAEATAADAQARDRGRARRPSTKARGARSSAADRAALLFKVADAIDAQPRRVHAHRHAQQRQAAARDASTTRSTPPTASATTPAWRPSRTARRSTCRRRRRRSRCANRSASAGRSCRGTIRC